MQPNWIACYWQKIICMCTVDACLLHLNDEHGRGKQNHFWAQERPNQFLRNSVAGYRNHFLKMTSFSGHIFQEVSLASEDRQAHRSCLTTDSEASLLYVSWLRNWRGILQKFFWRIFYRCNWVKRGPAAHGGNSVSTVCGLDLFPLNRE